MDRFDTVACGLGPASISPLAYLEENSALATLCGRGLCLIGDVENAGVGKLGQYRISANSLGKVFLELFEKSDSEFSRYIRQCRSYKKLEMIREEAPYLEDVADFMRDVGGYVVRIVDSHEESCVLKASVESIQYIKENEFLITAIDAKHQRSQVSASNVLWNLGGIPHDVPQTIEGLSPAANVITADQFIRAQLDAELLEKAQLGLLRRILIIGGSHSGFSALGRLIKDIRVPLDCSIFLYHRSSIRLYYASFHEAAEDGYNYDSDLDVCPLSGRVNRYSGLRYDSFNLAREVLRKGIPNVTLSTDAAMLSESYDLVIYATGYRAAPISIFGSDNRPIQLLSDCGVLRVNRDCEPYAVDGTAVRGLMTFGLGAGQPSGHSFGGEKSYLGRIDGIWYYQHVIGKLLLNKINGCSISI